MYNKKGDGKMENQKEYKTFLPVFRGFYENPFWEFNYEYIEDAIYEIRKENGLHSEIDINDLNINYKEYEKNIAIQLCDGLQSELSEYIEKITLESVYNPKAYNFRTDIINITIIPKIEKIKAFIYENKNAFIEYLKEKYTGYDGFISFYSNDFSEWQEMTKDFSDYSENEHILGSVLQFICNIEDITEFSLYDDIEKNEFEYIENWNDIVNQSDGSLKEFFTKNGYLENDADYFSVCYENKTLQYELLNEKTLSIIKEYENYLN